MRKNDYWVYRIKTETSKNTVKIDVVCLSLWGLLKTRESTRFGVSSFTNFINNGGVVLGRHGILFNVIWKSSLNSRSNCGTKKWT